MNKMSLKSIFSFTSLAFSVLLLVNIVVSYQAGESAVTRFVGIQTHEIPTLIRLHELWSHGLQTEQATRNIILNPEDQAAKNNYNAADKDFRHSLDALHNLDHSYAPLTRQLADLWDKAHTLRLKAQGLGIEGKQKDAVNLINKEETPLWREIKAKLTDTIQTESARIGQGIRSDAASIDRSRWIMFSMAATILIMINSLFFCVWRCIGRPTREVINYVRAVSEGDYFCQISIKGYPAEFATMAGHVVQMTETLKHKLGFAQGVLQGIATPFAIIGEDGKIQSLTPATLRAFGRNGTVESHLGKHIAFFAYRDASRPSKTLEVLRTGEAVSRELEVASDDGLPRILISNLSPIRDLGGKIIGVASSYLDITDTKQQERAITKQNSMLAQAANASDEVAEHVQGSVQDLFAFVEQAHRGAERQATLVSETATAMEEMNATVLEVAKNAAQAAQTAEQAHQVAKQGAEIVGQVVLGIGQVQEQALALKGDMTGLENKARDIGRIMNVISDIADQTNLLALNAAIEAARAGEAGRGFAVVADEVRKLAEKTMNATCEVEEAIHGIQDSTKRNMDNVDQAALVISQATKLANSSGQALDRIVTLVDHASDQVRSIATAAEEQSVTSEEITRGIENVHRISLETSSAMQSSAQSVLVLSKQADALKATISQMRHAELGEAV